MSLYSSIYGPNATPVRMPRPNSADAVALQTQTRRLSNDLEQAAERLRALTRRANQITAANRYASISASASTVSFQRARLRSLSQTG
jgi:transcription elongation GreA/GreB family factor